MEKNRDDLSFNLQDHLLGGVSKTIGSIEKESMMESSLLTSNCLQASIDATGNPLTDEALNAAKNADAVLLGAIGGPVCQTR